jgi:ribosomal protein S18 acetylase RimI-like enzyme
LEIRDATEADAGAVRALYDELVAELPELPWPRPAFEEAEGTWLLARDGEDTVGIMLVVPARGDVGSLGSLYVHPSARGRGVAKALLAEGVAALRAGGAKWIAVDVAEDNARARRVFERLGFREYARALAATPEELEPRLAAHPREVYGAVHVQSDDRPRVEDAVHRYVPRLGRSEHTEVYEPENGWIAVVDELCSREPELLRRLARELSDRLGVVTVSLGVEAEVVRYALFDRGRALDEYLSVPEYFGELPPGDVVALAANPTVVARLTGADPARVREVARTAQSPAELEPAPELYRRIAEVLGLTLPG